MKREQLQTIPTQPAVVDTLVADLTQQRVPFHAMMAYMGAPDPQWRDAGINLMWIGSTLFSVRPLDRRSAQWVRISLRLLGVMAWLFWALLWLTTPG